MTQRDIFIRINIIFGAFTFTPWLFLQYSIFLHLGLFSIALFLSMLIMILQDFNLEISNNYRIICKHNIYYIEQEYWFPFFWFELKRFSFENIEDAIETVYKLVEDEKKITVWKYKKRNRFKQ